MIQKFIKRPILKVSMKASLLILIIIHFNQPESSAAVAFKPGDKKEYGKKLSEVNRLTDKAMYLALSSKKYEELKSVIDSAEAICKKEKIDYPSALHLVRAEYFLIIGDFRSASEEGSLAINKSENNKENEIYSMTLNFFGRYNLRTRFYMESIEYFKKSIESVKKQGTSHILERNYNGLADVYDQLGNLEENRNSLTRLIEVSTKERDTLFMKAGLFRLGTSYTTKGHIYKTADSLLKRCLEVSLLSKDTSYISLALANLGWNNYLAKKYDLAIDFYNKSLSFSIPGKRYGTSANSLGNLGTIYRDMGETEKSIYYYKKAIEQAREIKDLYAMSWIYQDMSEMYIRKGDTSNAYNTFVLFKKYSDSNLLKSNTQGLSDARIKYEVDSHSKELELLSLRIRNQKLLLYAYTGLFILSLAIGILLLSRSKINAKRKISEMNRKISEVTQANLRQQMNPHFIFNTLNSIQYYMYQHDKLATNNYLTKFSSLMRKVLENSQHTSIPLRDELDALNLYLELEMIRFKDKFDYSINIDDEIDTILYKVPTMLIQPYVENSICHGLIPAEGKGMIRIDLKLENEYICCTIEDNGIGREAAQEKKRKIDNKHNSLGTQIVTSRLDLVNALYGTSLHTKYTDLKNEKDESSGTKVEIHIPILT